MSLHQPIVSQFAHGDVVTITIIDLTDNSVVVNGAACAEIPEIGNPGRFKYVPALTIDSKSYLFVMTNGTTAMDRIGQLDPIKPVSLSSEDVSGNIPANALAWNSGSLPTIPSAATVASQVRAELATELALLAYLEPTDHSAPTAPDPILDENGDPVEGARLYAYSDSDRTTLVASTTTDANGLWTLYFQDAGTYYIRCVMAGYDPLEWTEVVA